MKFQPPKGTKDYLPEEGSKLRRLLDIVKSVFEKYEFSPLFTPVFEDFGLLSAKGGLGEAVKDEIYYFKDKSDRELGLRFDLTMPMVRVVSTNPQMPEPFKRYAIGRVWRYDQPQAMRYREFWQADVDVVGTDAIIADVECLAVVCECLERLGFQDFFVRVNNRKIVQKVFESTIGVDKVKEAFRAVDKMDKIGKGGVEEELEDRGIEKENIKEIMQFIKISGSNSAIIKKIRKRYGKLKGADELEELFELAKKFGIAKRLKLDLSLVRGLDYYTGPVFEVSLGEDVSCGGGGRYDNLVKDVGGRDTPATGISLGITRIFEIMKNEGMFKELPRERIRIFVADTDEKLRPEVIRVSKMLRNKLEKVSCEIDLMGRNLSNQLEYADKMGMDYVVIVGEKELKKDKYVLKDMKNETQKKLKFGEIVKRLKKASKDRK